MNYSLLTATASNIRGGTNPPFGILDFLEFYPQFKGQGDEPAVPASVMDMYIKFANASISESRYHEQWKFAMCLFIAHFVTLYMQSMTAPDSPAGSVIKAGQTKGLVASKSVGGVSVSYDFGTALQGLEGFAGWTLTTYGTQLATIAKTMFKGGMYIY